MVTKFGLLVLVVLVASAVVAALAFGHSTRQGRIAAAPQPGVVLLLAGGTDPSLPAKLPPMTVESFSWKVTNTVSFGSASGGAGAGKAVFSDITLTVPIDSSLPALSVAVASGERFTTGVLVDTWNNAGHLAQLKDGFTNVFISSIEQNNTSSVPGGPPPPPGVQPGGFPMETITLLAEQNGWSFNPSADTTTTPTALRVWNVVTNSEVDCSQLGDASCNF
jgi:type VI protein secretion system component Hcp